MIATSLNRVGRISRRACLATALAAVVAVAAAPARAADKVEAIGIDWATYNPLSVLIKSKGLMEKEFAKDGIKVEWKQSGGSNIAVGALNSKAVDFGSTAGAAALMGRINGGEFKSVYVYSKPEWTALVTGKDSAIKSVADLKGKRVAAARGTDPQIFLIRALATGGMTAKDVKVVLLQHDAGMKALLSGEVDAWAGLDPLMAQAEIKDGAKLFYRNADFNTFGVLNVREAFAKDHPDLVTRVLKVYEEARAMAKANPAELKTALATAAGLPDDVIAKQLERTGLASGAVGQAKDSILAAGKALQEAGVIPADVDVAKTTDALVDTSYSK